MTDEDRQLLREILARLEAQERAVADIRSLVGPSGIPFPDGTLLVQTIHGTKYFIDPSDVVMAPQLVVYRQWESDVSALILGSLNANSLFVDVGANFGYLSCLAGSRIGNTGTGRVIAVEPNPKMLALLRKNISVNWSMAPIEVHECAASAEAGFVRLMVPDGHAANATISSHPQTAETGRSFYVRAATVDDITAKQAVDVLKIDVEGHEAAVLRGAQETIRRSPGITIVMEWSLIQMQEAGYSGSDVLKEIQSLGLCTYRLGGDGDEAGRLGRIGPTLSEGALLRTSYANIVLRHVK